MEAYIQIPSTTEIFKSTMSKQLNKPHIRRLSKASHSIGSFDEPGPICEFLEAGSTPENFFFKDFEHFKKNTQTKLSNQFIEDEFFFTQIIDAKFKNENGTTIETKEEKKTEKLVKKKSFSMHQIRKISNVLTKQL